MNLAKPNTIPRDLLKGWDVLIAEDEPDNLEVAERILKFYGANVLSATNGQQALELIKETKPKFIISDLSMPEMDGWALLHELKRERRTMDIPIIALTAHAMAGDRERAISAGFHNYLTKPLTPATFIRDLLNIITEIPELNLQIA
ncbi:MAG: response regulator [Anaerolineae bacterium]